MCSVSKRLRLVSAGLQSGARRNPISLHRAPGRHWPHIPRILQPAFAHFDADARLVAWEDRPVLRQWSAFEVGEKRADGIFLALVADDDPLGQRAIHFRLDEMQSP